MQKVIIETSENYRFDRVLQAVERIFDQLGGLSSFVKPGMRVAIKPNLLMAKKPDDAATTHPHVVKAVIALVQQAGGIASIVESPGGPYNATLLRRIYGATGMEAAANETGAELNYDLRVEKVENAEAKIVKSLKILKPLHDADLIINLAKLKTHGMMVYSGAVKNMFGSIAGLEKADYHMRMSEYDRFADSLIDIYLATKPRLNIIDGIIAMEGEGPSSGVPKWLGVLLGSTDGFACDYAALQIINVDYRMVPVLRLAQERGLLRPEEIELIGASIESVRPDDFDVPALSGIKSRSGIGLLSLIGKRLKPKPVILHDVCKLCGKCMEVCPPKIIKPDENKQLTIDYSKCIRCFCCHEFCPEKAIKIKKTAFNKLFEYKRLS
jgi:uncharacterized protein (DUF362 family)/Pyruvate/2-oxoacid:ferredoxin oxidoreductase delta subunit